MAERNRVISGTLCRAMVGGVAVGYGTGVSVQERYTREPVKVLGVLEAVEHKVVDYECSVSIDRLYIQEAAGVDTGLFAAKGRNSDDHISNLAALQPVSITVEDGERGRILGIVEGVEFESRDWRVSRGQLITESLTAPAVRFIDGSDLA